MSDTDVDYAIPEPPDLGIVNPYWDKVRPYVTRRRSRFSGMFDGAPTWNGMAIGDMNAVLRQHVKTGIEPTTESLIEWGEIALMRARYVQQYCWTIPDPWTLQFIAEQSGGRLIDPLAGTGYWGYLLGQLGINVASTDRYPPTRGESLNPWHPHVVQHTTVKAMDARHAVTGYLDRTLLLAWPPHRDHTGYDIVRDYPGDRIIYIGEPRGGCTGDDAMFLELEQKWQEVDAIQPVQYEGYHDIVQVFDRVRADKDRETTTEE